MSAFRFLPVIDLKKPRNFFFRFHTEKLKRSKNKFRYTKIVSLTSATLNKMKKTRFSDLLVRKPLKKRSLSWIEFLGVHFLFFCVCDHSEKYQITFPNFLSVAPSSWTSSSFLFLPSIFASLMDKTEEFLWYSYYTTQPPSSRDGEETSMPARLDVYTRKCLIVFPLNWPIVLST